MARVPGSLRDWGAGALQARTPVQAAPAGFRRAAVLLPLYETQAGPHLVLTKRTESVPTHKGQISFPGGGFEETDGDFRTTALREAEEEIGLHPQDVEVLGSLDDTLTASTRHVVRPFVGIVPFPYPYRLDPFEIEGLIHLPMRALLGGTPFREELWDRDGLQFPVYFYEHEGQTIWGLTARILKQFVEVVGAAVGEGAVDLPEESPPAADR
ncbi:MAG TPA: CoA pyrophosphatase [Candidatus Acidoferrum sp.]|nr:CoA pyrophosphatase [Candidatus Acidoferrum sp.]